MMIELYYTLSETNPNARNAGIQMGAFHGRKKQFEEREVLYIQSKSIT